MCSRPGHRMSTNSTKSISALSTTSRMRPCRGTAAARVVFGGSALSSTAIRAQETRVQATPTGTGGIGGGDRRALRSPGLDRDREQPEPPDAAEEPEPSADERDQREEPEDDPAAEERDVP